VTRGLKGEWCLEFNWRRRRRYRGILEWKRENTDSTCGEIKRYQILSQIVDNREIYDRIYGYNRRSEDKNFGYAVHDLADIN